MPSVANDSMSAAATSSHRSRVLVVGCTSPSSWGAWTWTCSGMARRSYGRHAYARRMSGACCAPADERHGGPEASERGVSLDAVPARGGAHPDTWIDLPAATFRMGDDSVWAYPGDGEAPVHDVTLDTFRIDRFAVTNDAFARFVDAT